MKVKNPKRQGGPKPRRPNEVTGTQQVFKLNEFQQSFDVPAFDNLVRSQGILVTHYRAVPDPTGMVSLGDVHASAGRRQSSDGFLYIKVGKMYVFFSSNSSNWDIQVEGLVKNDTAVMTMPKNYIDCDSPVILAPYDRFFIEDVEVRVVAMQYVEANITGIDKLQYPATCVEFLVDADGKEYREDVDFQITQQGFIKWLTQNRPGFNEKTSRGTVYSIRYRYIPYFVVARILHEIRVSQVTDPVSQERSLERMPYQVLVIREHVLSDVNRDPNQDLMDTRFQIPPRAGQGDSTNNGEGGML